MGHDVPKPLVLDASAPLAFPQHPGVIAHTAVDVSGDLPTFFDEDTQDGFERLVNGLRTSVRMGLKEAEEPRIPVLEFLVIRRRFLTPRSNDWREICL